MTFVTTFKNKFFPDSVLLKKYFEKVIPLFSFLPYTTFLGKLKNCRENLKIPESHTMIFMWINYMSDITINPPDAAKVAT